MTICSKKGCTKKATHKPLLLLKSHPRGSIATAILNLAMCSAHAYDCELDQILTNKGFENIRAELAKQGKPEPVRELTNLAIVRIKK